MTQEAGSGDMNGPKAYANRLAGIALFELLMWALEAMVDYFTFLRENLLEHRDA